MNWKTILKSFKNRDMQKRLGIVLGLVVVYRLLAHIPVPLTEPTQLKDAIDSVVNASQFGGFLNLLSGGALAQLSIVLVGLSPFITASIITQLLTKAIPKLEELHKDGESGRRKINQWTRMLSVPLAIVQSIAFIYILRQTVLAGNTSVLDDATPIEWVVAVGAMTAGAILLMWLGELITEQGIGNGISMLIFAGIISQLPSTLASLGTSLVDTSEGALNVFSWFTIPVNPTAFYVTLAVSLASLLVLYLLVKINEAQRVVTINYAKRVQGNSSYGGIKSILPIKLIAAGVIPVIFAVAFLSLPAFIGQVLKATGDAQYLAIANNLINWFQAPQPGAFTGDTLAALVYPASYFVLVILFTYFYTGIVFNANEISENLQKQGGFIEGIRPGIQTEKYLSRTVNRLILFGSLVLGLIAVLPFIAEYLFAQAGVTGIQNLAIGGTGLLIVVSVGLESLRQINSRALMVTYDDYK
ncbi:preprotein translocase subunit SecY [Candidatus Saccharibacteria bacterium RIFCSPHIGHO2_01_FULL_45_15]|nr:MAG: preprotein translocase subunit SecY [Candidatus Saccharibacteria bacterium RIFCSPHIGHO2_01_FULL_45_15]OGL27010.1 MAG: preprotein translocase subunit SecY [Candidatus Saccharibacteria bacterium RIFCSPHIGHO2_02_FULL_46_12]OGL32884.1 MAG: preprotein translocase subunit SecY [Candidatus Saccharibacteria bacterium RIFCSPHIGHO2_12_FULL_44_22]